MSDNTLFLLQNRRISTYFGLFKPFLPKGPFVLALILLIFALGLSWPADAHAGFFSNVWKFLTGNEEEAEKPQQASISMPLLGSESRPTPFGGVGGPADKSGETLSSTQDSALVALRNPAGTLPSAQYDQILVYTVQPGDTPGSIAERFGVSLNTILWANNIRNPNLIKIGDELVILPVSGIKYEVKKGDTIDSIAKKFKADGGEILSFNGLPVGESLEAGSAIIIPDGELAAPPAPASAGSRIAGLPEYHGYYLRPIIGGRRSRGLHGFNGVDLANSCGLPILSSAAGTVIIARSSGWNGGYGRYVVLTHPNGTQTLYSHLSAVLAGVGQYVLQGSQIATIGSTGNSTGCHVHFEVRGAKNPF